MNDALAVAVRAGQLESVRALLDSGVEPDARNFYGDSLIDMARDRGHTAVAAVLEDACSRGTRITSADKDDSEIHRAAEAGDVARVRALVEANPALVNQGDRAGGTPLHRAVIGQSIAAVLLLLDKGADIHAVHGSGIGSASGYAPQDRQPIDLAIWGGPRTIRPADWRIVLKCEWAWLFTRITGRQHVYDKRIARMLLACGAIHDLTIAAALGDADRVVSLLSAEPSRINETRPN